MDSTQVEDAAVDLRRGAIVLSAVYLLVVAASWVWSMCTEQQHRPKATSNAYCTLTRGAAAAAPRASAESATSPDTAAAPISPHMGAARTPPPPRRSPKRTGAASSPDVVVPATAVEELLREVATLPEGWREDPRLPESQPLRGGELVAARAALNALRDAAPAWDGERRVRLITADFFARCVRAKQVPDDDKTWHRNVAQLLLQRAELCSTGVDPAWSELLARSAVPGSMFPSASFDYSRILRTRLRNTSEVYSAIGGSGSQSDYRLFGEDIHGHIIVGWRPPNWNPTFFREVDDPATALAVWFQMWESFARLQREISERRRVATTSIVFIFDYVGVPFGKLFGLLSNGPYRACLFAGINHFPELTCRAHGINCSFALRSFYNLAKKLVEPRTVAKFKLHGHDMAENCTELVEEYGIPLSSLPTWLGGTSEGTPVYDVVEAHIAAAELMM